jgi:RNA polymerase sigma-70 factor (ECF subfamily)
MSDSFAQFLARLHNQDDAAAQELFVRFAHQLIALALRHIDAGLRHKVDPEDVVQSVYKSSFVRYGAGNLDAVNWNSLWGLLTLITVRKCAERPATQAELSAPPSAKRFSLPCKEIGEIIVALRAYSFARTEE